MARSKKKYEHVDLPAVTKGSDYDTNGLAVLMTSVFWGWDADKSIRFCGCIPSRPRVQEIMKNSNKTNH